MTAAAPSSHPSRHRSARRFGLLAAAAAVLVAPVTLLPTPAAANGLLWEVRWSAPVTATGPNAFSGAPELRGTAAPPVAGNPAKVSYSVALPKGYPAACAVPSGNATLDRQAFTAKPAMACNGTYVVSVVANQPASILKPNSDPLRAPIALADPGPVPATPNGAITDRRVTLSWAGDPDPDVVGYRLRRNGQTVAEPAKGVGAFVDTVPAAGTYTYDLQVLRWGAGGPASAAIASPPSAPATATVVDDAPPSGVGTGGGGTGTGSGGTGSGGTGSGGTGSGGSGSTGTGSIPAAGKAAPKAPAAGTSSGPSGSRSTYRSGGTISPRSGSSSTGPGGSAEPDTFDERLPYQPKATGRTVELASPDTTRTVARTTRTPGTTKPGLLVPMAVVLVLVAGSLQIRAFLRRTAPAGIELEPEPVDG